MIARNKLILSKAKLKLQQANQSTIEDDVLLDAANIVQNEIFASGDIERAFEIILKESVESYDFVKQECLIIIKIFTSWKNGKIDFRPNTKWDEYRGLTGNYPNSATIFGRKLYLSPIPIRSDDKLEIWGYQTKLNVNMDEEVLPELDETFDDALIWGICAQFDSSFFEKYQLELGKQSDNLNMKKQSIEDPEWTW